MTSRIKSFELSFDRPAANLACDEWLLNHAIHKECEYLRFWESPCYFVVLGSTTKIRSDVMQSRLRQDGIPLLRRHSGGGTVLQGPGCLNFSLVLSIKERRELSAIRHSYEALLKPLCQTFKKNDLDAQFHLPCDMALGLLKFSGNAQSRRKNYVLHHGTLLYNFDLPRISRYLRPPPSEPAYRRKRSHKEFVTNLPLSRNTIIRIVQKQFSTQNISPPNNVSEFFFQELIQKRYANKDWTYRF